MSIGIPIKLLYEAMGHKVTVELVSGEMYRGLLADVEDTMNMQLSDVTVTARDGRARALGHCFIRGSKIRFIVVPDILKQAPLFQKFDPIKYAQRGRGFGFGSDPKSRGRGGRGRGGRR
eukprot:TRINITY_DN1459_c0_g2_i1.p1 TRINITY_DN1459_c0_g2~~TRINITY_DN1459_c0_g2_i1.p1  ORF type:complete len:119 (-),score=28.36 TRINITY_DN1459_c0_g2_i1:142-498(-)